MSRGVVHHISEVTGTTAERTDCGLPSLDRSGVALLNAITDEAVKGDKASLFPNERWCRRCRRSVQHTGGQE